MRQGSSCDAWDSTAESCIKMCQVFDFAVARFNFPRRQAQKAAQTEFFHRKTSHDRPIHSGAPQVGIRQVTGARQMAHESARKSVARAGGIVNFIEGISRYGENGFRAKERGAVLAALDHHARAARAFE